MRTPTTPPRSADVSGRTLAVLTVLAAALAVAFVVAPLTLAANRSSGGFADQRAIIDRLRVVFGEYWRSGRRDFPSGLAGLVDYWFRYHVAKAAIAAILLIVLVTLGVLLWKAFLRADGRAAGPRVALASSGALATALALFSLVLVMVNVQGAIAPFASLLSMLPIGAPDGALAGTLDQVRQRLADYPGSAAHTPPALAVMISDFARYHAAMAVIAAVVAVALAGMSAASWKRFAATGSAARRTRRVSGSFGALSAVSSLAVIVVAVANTTTAVDPAPALLAFFNGS